MLEHIQKILKTKQLSPSQFADEIGVQRSSVSHLLSGRNKPSLDFVMKVLTSYPDLNPEWLLLDRGSMFKKSDSHPEISSGPKPREDETKKPGLVLDKFPGTENILQKTENKTGAEIERIVIFYLDGTFKAYRALNEPL